MDGAVFQDLAIAVGLGLLVGLQREWVTSPLAGIRTFPMITLFGVLSAYLARDGGGWVLAAATLALAGLLVVGNLHKLRAGQVDPGLTTEVAVLVMFAVGAAVALGHRAIAVTAGGTIAVLLHWKRPMHEFVARVGEDDLKAVIRLVLIALVILPVLPNRTYGPFDVLNPFSIWLMVVLIVGISLAAYVAARLVGTHAGVILGGVFGGLISSTATTVGYARSSAAHRGSAGLASVVIMIASTIVFGRVLFEIWVVTPTGFVAMAPPVLAVAVLTGAVAAGIYLWGRRDLGGPLTEAAPSDLRTAVIFGLMYAIVLLAVAAAREALGAVGLFGVAALSGLTDMDALTLSTAQLVRAGRMDSDTGWRLIVVAGMGNVVFKGLVVAVLGDRALRARLGVGFGMALAAAAAVLLLWG